MNLPKTVTINGKHYPTENLPEQARAHVANLQVVDGEIARLQTQLGIAGVARQAYVSALLAVISESEAVAAPDVPPPAEKPKKPRAPRKPKTGV